MTPDASWGASPQDAPPSYGAGQSAAVGFSSPSGAMTVTAGQSAAVEFGVASADVGPTTVTWRASTGPGGPQVTPSSGTLGLRPVGSSSNAAGCTDSPLVSSQSLTLTAGIPGSYAVHIDLRTTTGLTLPSVVLDVAVQS